MIRFLINYLIFTIVFFIILQLLTGFRDINEFFTRESVLALMEITFILFLYFFFLFKTTKTIFIRNSKNQLSSFKSLFFKLALNIGLILLFHFVVYLLGIDRDLAYTIYGLMIYFILYCWAVSFFILINIKIIKYFLRAEKNVQISSYRLVSEDLFMFLTSYSLVIICMIGFYYSIGDYTYQFKLLLGIGKLNLILLGINFLTFILIISVSTIKPVKYIFFNIENSESFSFISLLSSSGLSLINCLFLFFINGILFFIESSQLIQLVFISGEIFCLCIFIRFFILLLAKIFKLLLFYSANIIKLISK
ncbi:hypothetical protein BHC45_04900 [Snodgrassella alvi]|nr:hypothetical protein BHC45_04900 [Snodgrassella alvi]PIT65503.1 hypothetical protein BHC52_01475 [Snodgrassella alvi]